MSGSRVQGILAKYREEDIEIETRVKTLLALMEQLDALPELDKNELFKSGGFFDSSGLSGKDKEMFEHYETKGARIRDQLRELLELTEQERNDLSKELKNLHPEKSQSFSVVEQLLMNYNEKQSMVMRTLSSLVGNFFEIIHNVLHFEAMGLDKVGEGFKRFYGELESLLDETDPRKGDIFNALSYLLLHLEKYVGNLQNFNRMSEDEFLQHIKPETDNQYKFASNFYRAGRGQELIKKIKELLNKKGETAYDSLDATLKESVDKYSKNTLLTLFDFAPDSKTGYKDKVKDIYADDITQLKEQYETLLSKLGSMIRHDDEVQFEDNGTIKDLVVDLVDGSKAVSFRTFEEKHLKGSKKKIVQDVVDQLKDYTKNPDDPRDNHAYEKFVEKQVEKTLLKRESESSGGSSGGKMEEKEYSILKNKVRSLVNAPSGKPDLGSEWNQINSLLFGKIEAKRSGIFYSKNFERVVTYMSYDVSTISSEIQFCLGAVQTLSSSPTEKEIKYVLTLVCKGGKIELFPDITVR
jgi:gas vesicle protein